MARRCCCLRSCTSPRPNFPSYSIPCRLACTWILPNSGWLEGCGQQLQAVAQAVSRLTREVIGVRMELEQERQLDLQVRLEPPNWSEQLPDWSDWTA